MKIKLTYFDYAATTPLDERVMQKMLPFFTDQFGNPSSIHSFGQQAEIAIENARMRVAADIHARPEEIVFTACGTESDNLALRGAAMAARKKRGVNRIVISPVEHHAVLQTARQLADEFGFIVEYLPVDRYGLIDPADVEGCLHDDTALVSVVYANNEIGTIAPIAAIGAICRKRGVVFHTDAVQAAAHLKMDVLRDKVDLMAIGAHKFYGPKGVGALYIRNGTPFISTMTGGNQEGGMRAGTQNVPYIVGLAEALHLAQNSLDERSLSNQMWRDQIIQGVLSVIPRARLTGHPYQRLPNHASFVFEKVDGNTLLMLLDQAGFACSSGSACKVGNPQPSEVLEVLGFSRAWALGSLRVTTGRDTSQSDIDRFLDILPDLVDKACS